MYPTEKGISMNPVSHHVVKYENYGLSHFYNLVTDWVEGETTFPNAFHPITPSTTINVCELHIKFCEKCVIDRPYFI